MIQYRANKKDYKLDLGNGANKHKKGRRLVKIQSIIDQQISEIDRSIFKAERANKQRERRRAKRR
ncbi:MAG: hypothetical protein GOVbin3107_49 [Prokaryotic dsDNA virus sp.]|nr:MAG: hypothetical protein GOVbin3107_49 [Prokaryotic dsDNA virus sp.]|tara:strand:+ start:132 stop:326 length:195 start_codon:yes stop_codon:yes gene_type:complete